MATRPQCETYFVESQDPQGYNARSTQEQIKEFGRRRQLAMADELSRQACETYMEDIIEHMEHMEVNKLHSEPLNMLLTLCRNKLFQMLPQLISSKKSSGS